MTASEIRFEMNYRIAERTAILTDGRREPTTTETHSAIEEAELWRSMFQNQEAFARIEEKRESIIRDRQLERRFGK